ncbi:fumarylacetoacetate hydrolase family protein [Pseudorhodoferax sp. Leaf267]|uniref:fumarylacetoacetate hydrolase family protein n=1 Tax=Pseudorhodoferax sp. Leaf267 TaxID=1736316 RepID=UPI0006F5939E|nr:fumarylacetoacetate hydrolase family protein [Pseudorhodoferax sp. Leaf267]KQP12561.1 fumarylacetoacetate hydrolase [Pseudorhodoferax sp. Leaf267]
MKLATYKDGSRDGQLVVVARDLSIAHYASTIASRLQQVLDDWNFLAPQLQDLSDALNAGRARHAFPFDPRQCMAPLPRAGLWALADAYDAGLPAESAADPGLRLGAGHGLAGACDPVPALSEQQGIDFGAGLAVVTADIPQRASPEQALDGVRLVLLVNAVVLHADGLTAAQRQPHTAFGPVAVTLDELGDAWAQGRLQLPLQTHWNGRRVGMAEAGADMRWHFGELIAHLCATRPLAAGSIVGAGTVRNRGVEGKSRMEWPKGFHAIADKRTVEALRDGQAATGFLRFGDSLRIEMKDADGLSLFGAIEQEVVALAPPGVASARGRGHAAPAAQED